MDTIYQAIKNLLKAFVNLFVAAVELLAGLINGIASLLLKICPVSTGVNKEVTENKSIRGQLVKVQLDSSRESLVKQVRDELIGTITNREQYILVKAETEMFESSHIKRVFSGRKKRLVNAIVRELLETELRDCFLNEMTEEKASDTSVTENKEIEEIREIPSEQEKAEEPPVEKAKIQAICEVSKEAIS